MARALVTLTVACMAHLASAALAHAAEPAAEAQFLTRINALRASVGVAPLTIDPKLTNVARDWSEKMSSGTGLAHNPSLRSIIDGITSVWRKLGENVGWGTSVAQLHDALVNSPHHYANLIDPDFRAVGIGVVVKGADMWVTQDFIAGSTSAGIPAPTTSTTARPPSTTTTVSKPAPVRAKPAAVADARPVAVAVAPVPAPPPPPVRATPERMRVALEAEELLEKALRLPMTSGAPSRAR